MSDPIVLLPAAQPISAQAGAPIAITVTFTLVDDNDDPVDTSELTAPTVVVYSSAGTLLADVGPDVDLVDDEIVIAWSGDQTAELGANRFTWQLAAMIAGDGPFPLIAGPLRLHRAGHPGTATTLAVPLTVQVGPIAAALTVTVGASPVAVAAALAEPFTYADLINGRS